MAVCLGFYAVNKDCKCIYLNPHIIYFSNTKINFTSILKARDLAFKEEKKKTKLTMEDCILFQYI